MASGSSPSTGSYTNSINGNAEPWCLDSGATHDIAPSTSSFAHSKPYSSEDSILVGNGTSLPILNTKDINVST